MLFKQLILSGNLTPNTKNETEVVLIENLRKLIDSYNVEESDFNELINSINNYADKMYTQGLEDYLSNNLRRLFV
jgi:hemerythrin-like domain-containing protein